MSIRSPFKKSRPEVQVEVPECPHWELGPRWDNAADIGKKERIVSYFCSTCGRVFTPEEVEATR